MGFNILTFNGIAVKVNNSYIRECEFYTLTVTTDEHCHVDQTSYYVRKGTVVPLSPSFDEYYVLSGYDTVGCSVINGTVTVNQDCSVKINSNLNWFTLTVLSDGHAQTTSYFVEKGNTVTINPIVDQYYRFKEYQTTNCTISSDNKVVVNQNCSVKIITKENTHNISGEFIVYRTKEPDPEDFHNLRNVNDYYIALFVNEIEGADKNLYRVKDDNYSTLYTQGYRFVTHNVNDNSEIRNLNITGKLSFVARRDTKISDTADFNTTHFSIKWDYPNAPAEENILCKDCQYSYYYEKQISLSLTRLDKNNDYRLRLHIKSPSKLDIDTYSRNDTYWMVYTGSGYTTGEWTGTCVLP